MLARLTSNTNKTHLGVNGHESGEEQAYIHGTTPGLTEMRFSIITLPVRRMADRASEYFGVF